MNTRPLLGGARDDNNCLISAGYSWCESSNSCVRSWKHLVKIIILLAMIVYQSKEVE